VIPISVSGHGVEGCAVECELLVVFLSRAHSTIS
jgi:hypothetical protein